MNQPESPRARSLPDPVRSRVVALVAEVLPQVAEPPPSLRRVATFAAPRRARLGRNQIAAAIETDDDFRGHVAALVSALSGDLATALADGVAPAVAEPVEVAAIAWLTRADGWEALFDAAVEQVEGAADAVDPREVERLRGRIAEAEGALREQRLRHKERLGELKDENTSLRRKLGEARAAQRAVVTDVDRAATEAEQARESAEQALASALADNRRLKSQLEELQTQIAAIRRDSRSERDEATLRARLLLDTLLDAGQGLRRELALPPVSGAPGERVEAEIAAARDAVAEPGVSPSRPGLLEGYLAMPRARLLIDGYNVSKEAWPESSLEAQRIRLLAQLSTLVARTGAETTVVFDAASSAHRPLVNPPRGVKVLFSPEGVIADDVLRDLVEAEPEGRMVVVVTSDREVVRDVRRMGARTVGAGALLGLLRH
ncbi:NYN domain-containing protein [Nocardioides sp. Bht2]|uniref:NYN domain-containing protein n=1 Tax=Nocardioides sp. Bht2 TaxID=3392297 RepID=UPI0039B37982